MEKRDAFDAYIDDVELSASDGDDCVLASDDPKQFAMVTGLTETAVESLAAFVAELKEAVKCDLIDLYNYVP